MYRGLIIEDDMGIAEAIKTQDEMWEMEVCCARHSRNVMIEFVEFAPTSCCWILPCLFYDYHWCSQTSKVSKVPIIFIPSASNNMNMVMAMAKLQALLRRTLPPLKV